MNKNKIENINIEKKDKYGKENNEFIEKNPELEKITTLFDIEENSKSFSILKSILEKNIIVDESTKKLNSLKNNLA